MGPYKKVRRDGKWVTVDANGKVVDRAYRVAKGDKFRKSQREKRKKVIDKLKSRVRNFGERLVYSDQKGPDGKQLTVAQAKKRNLKINKESERKRKNIDAERKQIKINKQRTDSKNKPKPIVNKKDSNNNQLKISPEKKVEQKKDPLANYRRGPGTKLGKDTRITKKLKKAGFTEDRLAKLRKDHADFKAKRKKKKK